MFSKQLLYYIYLNILVYLVSFRVHKKVIQNISDKFLVMSLKKKIFIVFYCSFMKKVLYCINVEEMLSMTVIL